MNDIVNFLFEVGMLKKTPRSGFQFLGSGQESVAEHVTRTLFIGYVLCKLEGDIDESRVLKMCLFHDLPETRTGDLNYVNKKYVTANETRAMMDVTSTLFFGDEIESLLTEFQEKKTQASHLAHDADQLSFIIQLKEYGDLGNKYSKEWLPYALKRLCTETAKKLSESILDADSSDWWFHDKSDWWVNGKNEG
jgi:putative hydrolases of HD superfamily